MNNLAIIFAGGVGVRMNSNIPKQFIKYNDKEILIHTVEKFNNHAEITAIAIACLKEYIPFVKELVKKYNLTKVKWIVEGGATGQVSIYNGIKVIYEKYSGKDAVVLINDGVRPLVTDKLISECIKKARKYGGAVAVVKAIETAIYSGDSCHVEKVLDRSKLLSVKAPQAFRLDSLYDVARSAIENGDINNIDTLSLMYKNGYQVEFVETDHNNIKITTNTDFELFKALKEMEERQ